MATHQTKSEQITALLWDTGVTIDQARAIAPEAYTRDGVLYVPSVSDPRLPMPVQPGYWFYYYKALLFIESPTQFSAKWEVIP